MSLFRRSDFGEKDCYCSVTCYNCSVKTIPLSIRLDEELHSLLSEGARRTPLNRRELLRRTLRLHLREVIEQEAASSTPHLTNISPWPPGALAKAYKRVERNWEGVEAAGTSAQDRPSWDD